MSFKEEVREYFLKKGLYIVSKADHKRYMEVMTDSFFDYPLIHFMMDEVSRDKVELFFDVSIKAMGDNCITISDSNGINGILCFYAPNEAPGLMEFIRSGGLKLFPAYGLKHMIKTICYLDKMEKIMNKYRKKNDIYLYFLATSPDMQKKGIARKLLDALFDYCAENDCGVYLETNDKNDVTIYELFGFKLMECVKIDDNMSVYSLYSPARM